MTEAWRLIRNQAELDEIAEDLRAAERMAFDLEADGFHRYPEQTALLQMRVPGSRPILIDTLAVADLSAIGDVLADRTQPTILHAGGYDVRALHRDFGFHIAALEDTSLAAKLVGHERLGLANVLADRLDIEVEKSKRLQRFDWSLRPLPDEALDYAAGDVLHLFALADDLTAQLAALGRLEWLREECRRLADKRWDDPPTPREEALAFKGARDLTDRQRAILAAILEFRDAEARRIGRPPHYVLHNHSLLRLAREPDVDPSRLRAAGRDLEGDAHDRLREAIAAGREMPPLPWPERSTDNPWTPEARDRLSALKRWRREHAERLGLNPGVVWPRRHLEQVALHPDEPLESLDRGDPPWVRRWQWSTLGDSLRDELT